MNPLFPVSFLVIALSARMIVQMLVDAGFSAVAIDCYADEDTRALTLDVVRVASLAVADIQPAVDDFIIKKHGVTHLIYGSGFETEVASLEFLESRFVVMGNPANLFRRFQDKADFFKTLDQLSIPHPETVFSMPADGGDWLVKPMQGEGGFAIARYQSTNSVDTNRFYWQRYQAGEVFSVLFVVGRPQFQEALNPLISFIPISVEPRSQQARYEQNQKNSDSSLFAECLNQNFLRLLGFNLQWTCDHHEQAFMFAGISNMAPIAKANQLLLIEWLVKLIRVYPLQGLGSLDFIVHEGCCYVLEVNARIPASAQLYGMTAFHLHLQACLGKSVELSLSPRPKGFQIIYARQSLFIPDGMIWPEWVVDRPAGGVFIGKGQPVCSIIINGNDAAQVRQRLQRLQNIIENLLQTGLYHYAIPGKRQ